MNTAIWWIRRDFRLFDNLALATANLKASQIIPVFILDDTLLKSEYVGSKRMAFLLEGLHQLDADLKKRGSYLVIRRGIPLNELSRLVEECKVEWIFAEMDFSPYAKRRDQEISKMLPVEWVAGPLIHPPGTISKEDGEPYTVFTPFLKAWKAAPTRIVDQFVPLERIVTPVGIPTLPIPPASEAISFVAGESEALARLDRFINGSAVGSPDNLAAASGGLPPIYGYTDGRNQLGSEGTSLLSPYLRFGMISIRQVMNAAMTAFQSAPDAAARSGAQTWLNELVWREFYYHILDQFPHVRARNFRSIEVRWQNDRSQFLAWSNGETGYPLVDAAMRQLRLNGWIPNRLRMVVASFLTKDLLIDWRWGEKYFMQHLVDGDPAANNGGWQWTAGTGSDAAPYFRIFNPLIQSKKFDPGGDYIRNWLPELASITDEYIHEPGQMPYQIQLKMGCIIGKDYPSPIVNHGLARERALQAYRQESKPSGVRLRATDDPG